MKQKFNTPEDSVTNDKTCRTMENQMEKEFQRTSEAALKIHVLE